MSLVWRFALQPADLQGLSLAVGVAVTDALAASGVRGLQLKWPNDILYDEAKLGGVLIELVADNKGGCHVVVGVGLNVCMPDAEAADIDQRWTDIAAISAAPPARDSLLAALLNHLLPLMPDFEARGFAPWRERWLQLDAFAGRPVLVHSGAVVTAGTAVGIDASGDLLLQTDSGLQTLAGGEVSLRSAP
jgi:BirA family biotin operon repressor/biotin-[acetyl-CoA-carboxylase] ligase